MAMAFPVGNRLALVLSCRHDRPGMIFNSRSDCSVLSRCESILQDAPQSSEQAVLQPGITLGHQEQNRTTMLKRNYSGAGLQRARA